MSHGDFGHSSYGHSSYGHDLSLSRLEMFGFENYTRIKHIMSAIGTINSGV